MELDTKGLKCPLPIVRLGEIIRKVAIGDEVRIFADDKGFGSNVRAWCEKTGHSLVNIDENDSNNIVVVVRKE